MPGLEKERGSVSQGDGAWTVGARGGGGGGSESHRDSLCLRRWKVPEMDSGTAAQQCECV